MSIFYIAEIDGDEDFQQEQIQIITGKNLLLCLERETFDQLQDTINSNWLVKFLSSMADIEGVLKKYTNNNNIALVHHGNVYSAVNAKGDSKVILGEKSLGEYLPKVYGSLSEEEKKLTGENLINKLVEKSKIVYQDGFTKNTFIAYENLKNLIKSIKEGGNYFSIACDEADNPNILNKLGEFTEKNIKIYANTKFTIIAHRVGYTYGSKSISNLGSIMNIPLTENWHNNTGWIYFDKKSGANTATHKDLILKSEGKPYKLVTRVAQKVSADYDYMTRYYSKKYKNWYISNWKDEEYNKWKAGVKTRLHSYFAD